ncbi:MAG: hypothetical protein C5B57_03570 [Blastocatellia bacterium]|nr:MAG: hypothetical protein C5B57_03570 [Blastocatellia bacterium]
MRSVIACAFVLCVELPAQAQTLPSEPVVFGNGRVTLGSDVSWSISPQDPGFFNYTDYEHSALRLLRLSLTAAVKAGDHMTVLADVRSENGSVPEPYGFYLRVRPWASRQFDIQIGRVPPTVGAFARRSYSADNPLIGYPLAYQYLTSLRPDALPANADELLRMRGRGWLAAYSIGNLTPDRGLPLISAFRWDTGVQVHAGNDFVDATASVTAGTPSNPLLSDDNDGRQIAGRVAFHPIPGLVVGGSAARGPFVSDAAVRAASRSDDSGDFTQTVFDFEVEYSRDYYLLRSETVISDFTLPIVGTPEIELPLRAVATFVEGRYKMRPRLYAAARVDYLGFSKISGSLSRETWEAPVTRFELGGGYSIQRNLVLKVAFQHNARSGGRVRHLNLPAAQVVFWF